MDGSTDFWRFRHFPPVTGRTRAKLWRPDGWLRKDAAVPIMDRPPYRSTECQLNFHETCTNVRCRCWCHMSKRTEDADPYPGST